MQNTVTCFMCGEPGHFARDCIRNRSAKSGSNKSRKKKKRSGRERRCEAYPEPEPGLLFADCHCHPDHVLSHPSLAGRLTAGQLFANFFVQGGQFLVQSTLDWTGLQQCLEIIRNRDRLYYTAGWAPQTVTYSPEEQALFGRWKDWVRAHAATDPQMRGIGEFGLDFHHAKALHHREEQIRVFREILALTKEVDKNAVLHIRNAGPNDKDPADDTHDYNAPDAATRLALEAIDELGVDPRRVMFHCFPGPAEFAEPLSQRGVTLSIPSSVWALPYFRAGLAGASLDNMVTETDSPFQAPARHMAPNTPANARYAIAAIASVKGVTQSAAAERLLANARRFFGIPNQE
eukprot:gnl/Trimastix_PCT/2048.p2 GENE.gnl/Trimastix_PCT/2048~~gnl/Trimastix_PCT/2048.p2  ORF type:complete len:347 (-),score=87.80 gnl/Trimastix_PCT/2048:3-1043(-)